jgi:hypothetical protein
MPRKKKQKIAVNNTTSLEGLLQEVYNDACGQISSAQKVINEISTTFKGDDLDVDDATKMAKAKVDALKIKDSGARIKLEVSKLLNDVVKHNGNVSETIQTITGEGTLDKGLDAVREMVSKRSKDSDSE